MTIQDRIVAYLAQHPEGVDDDALAAALAVPQRQQVNQRCRRMEQFGIVTRRRENGKIRNFLNSGATLLQSPSNQDSARAERPWFWEGNVQADVVLYLERLGYRISFVANTAIKQQGKDIIAFAPSGQTLWVSAKGYPAGTVKTNPRTQARHWFSHALFDLILWHGQDISVGLALALPDQATYRNLAARASWFLRDLNACIFWVSENGIVTPQEPHAAAATGGSLL